MLYIGPLSFTMNKRGDCIIRNHWSSRFGFILAAVGSAVGLGNIWKFPFITGMNGGGAFVLVYLIAILSCGLPILMAEFLIGRHSQKDVVGSFRELLISGTLPSVISHRSPFLWSF